MTALTGRVIKVGDDLNTDMILPGAYLNLTEPEELAPHLLETYPDPEIAQMITAGDILVAGRNCGCGSSREQAQLALLGRGVQAVVAVSFARIFLRNCLNLGLLAIEQPEAASALRHGESLTIDTAAGRLSWEGGEALMPAQPPFVKEIIASGGLVGWVRERLEQQAR